MSRSESPKRSGFVTPSRRPDLTKSLVILVIGGMLVFMAPAAGLNGANLREGLPRLADSARGLFALPDWSSFPDVAGALLETLELGFVGTIVALPISFLAGLLIARNTSIHPVVGSIFRAFLSVARAVPFFVWAMILISIAGLGVLPGVMALVIASSAFGAKLVADSLEHVEREAIEGVQAAGAGWLEVRRYAIIPQALRDIGSQALFMFEVNIRMSIAVGIVGAGGIGYKFSIALRNTEYGRVALILVSVLAMVAAIEWVSRRLRERMA